jgi:hypothetical protein
VALANDPVPEVLQVVDVAPPDLVPVSATVPIEQIVWSAPAPTTAAGLIVRIRASLTGPQTVGGSLVVRVRVTKPADLSARLGVYVVFKFAAFANVPVPEEDQVEEVAPPPRNPVTLAVAVVEQIV